MKTQRMLLGLLVMGSALGLSVNASAAKKQSFDLYSWAQKGSANFCYAILPSKNERRAASEIMASKDKVCGGSGDLKRIMGQAVPLHSKVTWKTDSDSGMVLPERGIVNDLKRFADTMPYKLVVEEHK